MTAIRAGARGGGHQQKVACLAFAPDSQSFVAGDASGELLLRSRGGDVLARVAVPRGKGYPNAWPVAAAFSPDGRFVATTEGGAVRLRSARDLSVVAEHVAHAYSPIVFADHGRAIAFTWTHDLHVLAVPSLEPVASVPVARRRFFDFTVGSMTADPGGSVVVTCDSGGTEEDETCHTIDRDSPQVTVLDARTGKVLTVIDDGTLTYDVDFDPFRRRIYTATQHYVGVWSPSGELLRKWTPYAKTSAWCKAVAVNARFLVTLPDRTSRAARSIDLWEPETLAPLASAPLEAPVDLVAVSPDGTRLVTPSGDDGVQLWEVVSAMQERATTCVCEQAAAGKRFTDYDDSVVETERKAVLATCDEVHRDGEEYTIDHRCRVCGTVWTEHCRDTGPTMLWYLTR